MNITNETESSKFPSGKMNFTTNEEVTLEVSLMALASELGVAMYGAECDSEHIEYFKRLIKKHSK